MDSQTKSSKVAETVAELKGIPTREKLVEMLTEDVYSVTFDKINGDERTMTCTLNPQHLPAATRDEPLSQTKIRNLEDRTVVDAQLNYTVDTWKSVFKIGAANLGGKEYFSAPGTGGVGSQYFVSWTINP